MAMTYSQLGKLRTPEKPEAHALSGRLGIYLRLYPSGDHQWYWRGIFRNRAIWVWIGPRLSSRWTLKALQDEAIRLRQLADQGIDPNGQRSAPEPENLTPTLNEAWETFKAEYVIPLRSSAYLEGMEKVWQLHVQPRFGSMRINAVTTATAMEIVRPLILDKKLTTANRLRAQLSKLYNWSAGRWPGLVEAVNWTKAVVKAEVHVDERILTKKELAALGKGFRKSRSKHKLAILWILLTGSRSGVLKVWDPSWVDGQVVVIPRGVEGVKKARAIVMPKAAASLIPLMTLPVTTAGLRHALDDVVDHSGIRTGGISPHTLRKTWSSIGADIGEPEAVIDALQNHKGSAIKQAYIRRSFEAMLPTSERIAEHLLQVMKLDVDQLRSEEAARRAADAGDRSAGNPGGAVALHPPEAPVGAKAARMVQERLKVVKPRGKV